MVEINQGICTGCGKCIQDCPASNITLIEGRATARGACINCGHCVAICPVAAVSLPEYPLDSVVEYQSETFDIPAETLLNFIKFRRSIRHFKTDKVENEKIACILEAGRHIPTGGNRQNVRSIVVVDQLQTVRKYILESLDRAALLHPGQIWGGRYDNRFHALHKAFLENPQGEDGLFFHAPLLLLAVSDDPLQAALASTGMELEANALGLGCLYSGFSTAGIENDAACRDLLGLAEGEHAVCALLIGYPAVTYQRTAPRKKPDVTMM
ncbi:MAG: nitroreductase family protein [Raoultibacter sp.]